MKLIILPELLSICRMAPGSLLPDWLTGAQGFLSLTWTPDELSIVAESQRCPASIQREDGWRALKVAGPLAFSEIGILSALAVPLADAGISIFAISTFETDYLLVKVERLTQAIDVLQAQGHIIQAFPPSGNIVAL